MKRIVNDFINFVKINADSKDERKIANRIKEELAGLGCEVIEDDTNEKIDGNTGNIVARLKGNKESAPKILLAAHMDRVKNGKNIRPVIKDNKIVSEGSTILAADDVAGIVSILDGIRKIKEEKIEHGEVEIVFSVCEEKGITGTKYLDYSKINSNMGYIFDSSGRIGRIVNQAPSKISIEIKVYGKPAHAGNEPEKGINAIKVAAVALANLNEGRLSKSTTSNFGIIRGGEGSTNVICDFVEIFGEMRSTTDHELEEYKKEVKKHFFKAAEKFNTEVDIDFKEVYRTFYVKEDEDVIKLLKRAMEKINIDYYFDSGGGGLDANRFNAHGIQSVGVATGYINNHTFEEEIYIPDLIRSGELVKSIIIESTKKI